MNLILKDEVVDVEQNKLESESNETGTNEEEDPDLDEESSEKVNGK
ncbi:hypothetical protein JOC75_000741 [Metabacillus crassostreae]|nr:hypothetical protein [Metabacillus crassostreae]MBM7602771.1 hypothetical protein [Metabacillus crassostreae]